MPYTSSVTSRSLTVSGISQNTFWGPKEMFFPLTVNSLMSLTAPLESQSVETKVTQMVRDSGTNGYWNSSSRWQPCGSGQAGGTVCGLTAEFGLQVLTLDLHGCSTSGWPMEKEMQMSSCFVLVFTVSPRPQKRSVWWELRDKRVDLSVMDNLLYTEFSAHPSPYKTEPKWVT